jgi:hypothetical protein
MYCKGHPECRRFGYARGGSLQGSNFEPEGNKQRGSTSVIWPRMRAAVRWHTACSRYMLALGDTAAAGDSLAQTISEPALIAGLLSCQCFTLTARTEARANGRASYGELSAVPKCHPCISLALVRFLPSQWTPSETWACRSGEILWAFMARDGPALVLAMGFGRIG